MMLISQVSWFEEKSSIRTGRILAAPCTISSSTASREIPANAQKSRTRNSSQ